MLFFGICKGLGEKSAFGGKKSAFQGVFAPQMHFPCLRIEQSLCCHGQRQEKKNLFHAGVELIGITDKANGTPLKALAGQRTTNNIIKVEVPSFILRSWRSEGR